MKLDRVSVGRQGYLTGLAQAERFGEARGLAGEPRESNPYSRPDFRRRFFVGWLQGAAKRQSRMSIEAERARRKEALTKPPEGA